MKLKNTHKIGKKCSKCFFLEQGDYKWMARQLKEYKTVLELGCGTGQSTLSLLQQGLNVIAVDKNPSCLSLARKMSGSISIIQFRSH